MKTIICIGCGTVGYATCLSLSSLGHSIIGIDTCLNARNRMIKYGFPCYSPEEILFENKFNDIKQNFIQLFNLNQRLKNQIEDSRKKIEKTKNEYEDQIDQQREKNQSLEDAIIYLQQNS